MAERVSIESLALVSVVIFEQLRNWGGGGVIFASQSSRVNVWTKQENFKAGASTRKLQATKIWAQGTVTGSGAYEEASARSGGQHQMVNVQILRNLGVLLRVFGEPGCAGLPQ